MGNSSGDEDRRAMKYWKIIADNSRDEVRAWVTSQLWILAGRKLKQQPGKNMHVVGGATLVGSLMNASLIDEVQLIVNPLFLGSGKALFKDVKERTALKQIPTKPCV
jgi:dihydrofolate reductase